MCKELVAKLHMYMDISGHNTDKTIKDLENELFNLIDEFAIQNGLDCTVHEIYGQDV